MVRLELERECGCALSQPHWPCHIKILTRVKVALEWLLLVSGVVVVLVGRPIYLMLSKVVANPLIIVDEICKSRTISTTRGANHAFAYALLSLLGPATALSGECQYFCLRFDMSHISWVLTSNNINNVPALV